MTSPISPLAPKSFPHLPEIRGVRNAVGAAGIKYQDRTDIWLAEIEEGASVAGVFTQSKTAGAPVLWCRKQLEHGTVRGLLVNSGNSNAFTGAAGEKAVAATAELAAKSLGVDAVNIMTASTGVIGEPLPVEPVRAAMDQLTKDLGNASYQDVAEAIRTTDTFAKGASAKVGDATIVGIAKGSGMIAPDMATMLAFVFTDAVIEPAALQTIVSRTNERTFNAITVDSDTSTSDTLIAVATRREVVNLSAFERALETVLLDLAHQIVRDGEGASKFVSITVRGAEDDSAAKAIGLSVANSPLVKTAIAGEDANWGRIVMAVGKSGEAADRDKLSISIGGIAIARNGQGVKGYDETPVAKHMQGDEVDIAIDIGLGEGKATVWTCDLTHGYISINADYRS